MNTHGGFLLDVRAMEESDVAARRAAHATGVETEAAASSDVLEARRLTAKQEVRLMNYLDDAFQQLNRGFTKRYTSSVTSSVPTLDTYLARTQSMLSVIASIPPVGGTTQLLINYLLRYTSEVTDGIQGYELGAAEKDNNDDGANRLSADLERTVHALDLLDRIWAATLRGKMINWKLAEQHARDEAGHVDDALAFPPGNRVARAGHEQRQAVMSTGRYPAFSSPDSDGTFDSRSIVGSRGYATVSQTLRIRLRNIITLAKENLFAWMRTQLDAPLPPVIDGSDREAREERRSLVVSEGNLEEQAAVPGAESEAAYDDLILEDVDTSAPKQRSTQVSTHDSAEQTHYDALFSKAVDPDADDSDDVDDGNDDDDDSTQHTHKRTRTTDSGEEGNAQAKKRQERSVADDDDDKSLREPTEVESEATFMGTAGPNASAVMRWDVAFAHLFSRTLRSLSDIQEYYNNKARKADDATGGGGGGILQEDETHNEEVS